VQAAPILSLLTNPSAAVGNPWDSNPLSRSQNNCQQHQEIKMNTALNAIKQAARSPDANDRFASRTIRTFLADDSPFMMALLARLLGRDERIAIVGSATDGRKAVQAASTSRPDLVLMDLHMPGLDGAEATYRLKQLRNPPIVFVATSDDTPEARARSLRAGADAYLLKTPNLAAQLQTAIQDFFGSHLTRENGQAHYPHEAVAALVKARLTRLVDPINAKQPTTI